ncbi:MAG: dipeptide epimerase [Phenylobacterium sp.]|uniref:N-acetyl-D-Glu racemase DgcA n=1 Tax=Phenylobacterium sp. TaxID=1871053 RepID=UPI002732CECE|nr:N-acetyl-D-Glu racemase DgcA [Phenylobacterium sp.]MDP3173953.1 dipeptide epimerase [Phenylobacterium sp.]
MRTLSVRDERWPTAGEFRIARGAKYEAHVIVVEIAEGAHRGRGESTPYLRNGETIEGALAQVAAMAEAIEAGASRNVLQTLIEPGAARNALDCALWDLEAKRSGTPAWRTAGLERIHPLKTCFTIGMASAEDMAAAAKAAASRPMLKLKIGGGNDLDRVAAVRAAAPKTRLIVDANEGLSMELLRRLTPELAKLGVALIEQPLPASEDVQFEGYESPVPLCADESLHTRAELDDCARRYACVNIKLDKAGGLTEALAVKAAARERGLMVMAGCMVATSLAMAPAMILAQGAEFVDLDGPLLLLRDREPGLAITGSILEPPKPELWG